MRINGVFQGGGVKGIGLVGAVYAAEQRGVAFHQTAGTSVGALVAALIAAGYNGYEMRDLLMETDIKAFVRPDWYHRLSVVGQGIRLLVKKGLYSPEPMERWLEKVLAEKGIRTFGDLPQHAFRAIASDISQGKLLVLPDDIAKYGYDPDQLSVARAVRMSASIPYFFDPYIIKQKQRKKQKGKEDKRTNESLYIVDGGILSNYPLWIFDREMKECPPRIPTIGFQLVGSKHPEPRQINGPISMLSALFATMSAAHDERYIERHSRFRTVKIPSHMANSTEFHISKEKLNELFRSGVRAGDEFFSKWSYSGYSHEMTQWWQEKNAAGGREKPVSADPDQ